MLSRLYYKSRTLADYHKEILLRVLKPRPWNDMLDLLETMPDSQLTLTHFDDSQGRMKAC